MNSLVQIGTLTLDLLHVLFALAAIGLGFFAHQLYQQVARLADQQEELEKDLQLSHQQGETQRQLAEAAKLELAQLKGQTESQR